MRLADYKNHNSELAGDVRVQYMDALRCGKDGPEATAQLIADYEPALLDEEDAPNFWFALADVQWNAGRLEEDVKQQAMAYIKTALGFSGSSADDTVYSFIPRESLLTLQQKLSTPQPSKKTIRPYRLYRTDWKAGDVFAYRLSNESTEAFGFPYRYVYFVINGTSTWHPGHVIPVAYVYWMASKELLELAQLRNIEYLPQFYKPIAYQNNPSLKSKYTLGLICTSARSIPGSKLVFLGRLENIEAVEHDVSSTYCIAWKNFDKYMIENYMAWEDHQWLYRR